MLRRCRNRMEDQERRIIKKMKERRFIISQVFERGARDSHENSRLFGSISVVQNMEVAYMNLYDNLKD